ncbi:MAG: hypothetical protein LBU09_03790 [Endomicrobium sp.]|jgi:hypothetical protein|nr:hypothetical protein [Endomicrobium sp.]
MLSCLTLKLPYNKVDFFDMKLVKEAKKIYSAIKTGREEVYVFEEMRAKHYK